MKNRPELLKHITETLRKSGKAKYDFGTFYLHHRKGHIITLRNGKKKKIREYTTVFFRGSVGLRGEVKKWKL